MDIFQPTLGHFFDAVLLQIGAFLFLLTLVGEIGKDASGQSRPPF